MSDQVNEDIFNDLTPLEKQILERSSNPGITRRRRTMIITFGLTAAVGLSLAAFVTKSLVFVVSVSLMYITVTVLEKVLYANAVIVYKGVIHKLKILLDQAHEKEGA